MRLGWLGLFLGTVSAWSVHNGVIHDNAGKVFPMKGISWFGFETQDFVINGLWQHPAEFYMDLMKQHGINTIRIPFSAEWIWYNYDLYPYDGLVNADPKSQHKKSIDILDRIFDLAEERQMHIMLDLHRLHKEYISEVWYSPTDGAFTTDTYFDTWFRVLDRYHGRPALLAVDLLNEPHGSATWGDTNPSTDWNHFAEFAIEKIDARYPDSRWLYLVEGIGWGKDLSGARAFPIQTPERVHGRLVYSPHTYGKSVVSTTDVNNRYQLYHDWDSSFGFLKDMDLTYMVGEYGGITSLDSVWMNTLVDYLTTAGMRNAFFWSLGPNSGDVHGLLLDDWTTLDGFKMGIMDRLQPSS
ncbi:hypothetical protein EBZ80_04905 [bacterium]|nr:hypothetical protein [bacterium]